MIILYAASEHKLLTIDGTLNHNKVDNIVFDIGATMSILSERVAKKHGIKYFSDGTKVRLADDSLITVCGRTEPIEVNIRGNVCTLPMLVLKHKEYDVLLGIDYFNHTGAGIYPRQRIIKYNKREVHLNELDEIEDQMFLTSIDNEVDLDDDL